MSLPLQEIDVEICDDNGDRITLPATELDVLRTLADTYAEHVGEERQAVALMVFGRAHADDASLEATLEDLGIVHGYTILAWRFKVGRDLRQRVEYGAISLKQRVQYA